MKLSPINLPGMGIRNLVTAEALVARINEMDMKIRDATRNVVMHSAAAGRLLIEAKKLIAHGGWEAWVTEHLSCSARTAQTYMQLARGMDRLTPDEAQRVADLPLRDSLKLMAYLGKEEHGGADTTRTDTGCKQNPTETLKRAIELLNQTVGPMLERGETPTTEQLEKAKKRMRLALRAMEAIDALDATES